MQTVGNSFFIMSQSNSEQITRKGQEIMRKMIDNLPDYLKENTEMNTKSDITRTQIDDIKSQVGFDAVQRIEEMLIKELKLNIDDNLNLKWRNDDFSEWKKVYGIGNNNTGKQIFSEMDPYGEENWD